MSFCSTCQHSDVPGQTTNHFPCCVSTRKPQSPVPQTHNCQVRLSLFLAPLQRLQIPLLHTEGQWWQRRGSACGMLWEFPPLQTFPRLAVLCTLSFTALMAHPRAALPRSTSCLPGQAGPVHPVCDASLLWCSMRDSCTTPATLPLQGDPQSPQQRAPAWQPFGKTNPPVPGAATGALFIIFKPNTKQTTASACLSHCRTAL